MQTFRKILSLVILGLLFMPLIQGMFHVVNVKPLSGSYTLTNDTLFTINGWFTGKYQVHKEEHLRDTFGFRELFIRAHNQVDYDFFNKVHAHDFIIGKNDDMFPGWYLESYTGSNFAGTWSLTDKLDKIKHLQDALEKIHKTLLFVITPSKNLFEPENIPGGYPKGDSTNYELSLKLLREEGIHFIDFNGYFIAQKHTLKYPLFSKYGSHWSAYGACLAGDSIITMLEKLRGVKMPHNTWKDTIIYEEASEEETEMEMDLNLLFPLKHTLFGHPKIKAPLDSGIVKPGALIIGDSYVWGLIQDYNIRTCFSSFDFLYYFKTVYLRGSPDNKEIEKFNLKDAINKNDIFIIISSEANLATPGWGFAKAGCKVLNIDTAKENSFNYRVAVMRNEMKVKTDFMKMIAEKAKAKNLSVDSILTLDAMWLVGQQKN